jgi:glycopeptide antibiotics resistance protein
MKSQKKYSRKVARAQSKTLLLHLELRTILQIPCSQSVHGFGITDIDSI